MNKKNIATAFYVLVLTCLVSLTANAEYNNKKNSSHSGVRVPDGFNQFLLFMGNGIYDPADPTRLSGKIHNCSGGACDGDFFQKDIMDRTDEDILALREDAKAHNINQFNIDVDDPALAGRIDFNYYTVDPDIQYRLYHMTGKRVPKKGWIVRDGFFRLAVIDPDGIDIYGENGIKHLPFGTATYVGNYNILVTNRRGKPVKEMIISYKSSGFALYVPDDGAGYLTFRCDMFSDEFGEGQGFGAYTFTELEDGRLRANGRNIITFPTISTVFDFPDKPVFDAHPRH